MLDAPPGSCSAGSEVGGALCVVESLRPRSPLASDRPSVPASLSVLAPIPSGPAIILIAAVLYVVSLLFGNVSGLVRQMFPGRHLEA